MITEFEEFKKENNFIEIYDDDGLITIQMSVDSVKKIIDEFDSDIKNKIDSTASIEVNEFDKIFNLEINLNNEKSDGFSLTASIENGNFYNNFELEYCTVEDWIKIKNLVYDL